MEPVEAQVAGQAVAPEPVLELHIRFLYRYPGRLVDKAVPQADSTGRHPRGRPVATTLRSAGAAAGRWVHLLYKNVM